MIGNGDTCMLENLKLFVDEACLEILNMRNETLTIFGQYTECRRCKFKLLAVLQPGNYTSVSLNTRYPAEFYFTNETESEKHYCRFEKTTLEHYIYGWNILSDECGEVFVKRDAPNYLIPILFALIALLSLGILWYTLKYVHEILKSTYAEFLEMVMKSKSEPPTELDDFSGDFARNQKLPDKTIRLNNRIKSIDVFRGLCMMLMIFVFSGGGHYWFFNHVIWNGFTIADLIFPWFKWLMGISFSISLQKKLQLRIPKRFIILQVIKRSLIFVCMGIIINSNSSFTTLSELRLCGVLQRFGLCYLIVGLLEVPFAKKMKTEQTSFSPLGDILNYRYQFLGVLAMLFVHTYFTFFFDVPDGCGRGYLGPGGLDEGGKYENCTAGAAGYIDRLILGNRHLFKSQIRLYENKQNYDHEGLLGTLTSVFLVYMGVQCGHIFNMYQEPKEKVKRMLIWGSVTLLSGLSLCGFNMKDYGLIPLNKKIWSLSFVLVVSGTAFFVEVLLFLIVDVHKKWGGKPLLYVGMNPLFLYVGYFFLKSSLPFTWRIENGTHFSYLFLHLWTTFLWVVIAKLLYEYNIFVIV